MYVLLLRVVCTWYHKQCLFRRRRLVLAVSFLPSRPKPATTLFDWLDGVSVYGAVYLYRGTRNAGRPKTRRLLRCLLGRSAQIHVSTFSTDCWLSHDPTIAVKQSTQVPQEETTHSQSSSSTTFLDPSTSIEQRSLFSLKFLDQNWR